MKYKFISLLLSVLMSMVASMALAYDAKINGIYYNFSGTEAMVTYYSSNLNNNANAYSGSVTIPESVTYNGKIYSVTSIGDYAFRNCSGVTSITIPESVTSISYAAFTRCSGLTSVTIPNSITNIGDYAFELCSGLTSITIGSSVTSIGSGAFSNCTGLTSVVIPNSVTSIGQYAFSGCSIPVYNAHVFAHLNSDYEGSYEVPDGIEEIADGAFSNCSGLTSVTIPNSVTDIGNSAFRDCSGLTSVTIGNGVTSIGYLAFYNCSGLTSVTIPNSVTDIGYSAFQGCSGLTSVTIGNSVTSIGNMAFYNCSGLTSVTIPESVSNIVIDAFSGCSRLTSVTINSDAIASQSYSSSSTLAAIFGSQVTAYVFGEGVQSIGQYACYNCSSLTSVTISNTINSIGYSAFYKCNGMASVTIPNSVTSIGGSAFNGCRGLTSISIPNSITSIGNNAFYNCSGLTKAEFGSIESLCGIQFGSNYANPLYLTHHLYIGGSEVTDLVIPNGVTSIGSSAFYGCSGLISVSIPNSVTSIGSSAFSGCNGLTKAEFGSIEGLCGIQFGDSNANPLTYAHHLYIEGSEVTDLVIPNSVTSIGSNAFNGCSGLTSVTIGNSVTSISSKAFSGCTGVTFVTLNSNAIASSTYSSSSTLAAIFGSQVTAYVFGEGVQNIGQYACYNCSSLTSVTISNSVTSLGSSAFYNCSGLTSVTIPNSITSIGSSAFENCSSLTKAEFGSIESLCGIEFGNASANPLSYAHHLYIGGSEVTNLVIPNSVTSIGNYAFKNCSGLTSVTIPNCVTSIGSSAFSGCSRLTSVTIPESVTSIGDSAFYGCSGLTSVTLNSDAIASHTYSGSTTLATFFGSQVTAYVFGEGVQSIGQYACYNCSSLTSVTISNNVTSIGESAFYGCNSLTKAEFGSIKSLCGIQFGNYTANPLYYAHHLYIGGSEITDLVIPNGVTSIGEYAFLGCTGLTSVTIPNSVTSIGYNAFYNSSGLAKAEFASIEHYLNGINFDGGFGSSANPLYYAHHLYIEGSEVTDLVIPNGVTSIGSSVFSGCSGLTSVTIPNSVTSIGQNAFSGCSNLTKAEFASIEHLCGIQFGNAYSNPLALAKHLYIGDEEVTTVTIPENVSTIGQYTFYNCEGLTSIDIPNNVESIGESAFYGCTSLANVTLDCNNVGTWFRGITSIKDLTLRNNVQTISNYAFQNCSGLLSVCIGSGVTNFGYYTFSGCNHLAHVSLDCSTIGNWFNGLTSIREVTLGNNVQSINEAAFSSCNNLDSATVGDNVTSIGNNAFPASTSLFVNRGTPSLLVLWNAGYLLPYQMGTEDVLLPSVLNVVNTTQATVTAKVENFYNDMENTLNDLIIDEDVNILNSHPEYTGELTLRVSKGGVTYTPLAVTFQTLPITPTVERTQGTASSMVAKGSYLEGDAQVTSEILTINGVTVEGDSLYLTGLNPNTSYSATYRIMVDDQWEYTKTINLSTDTLSFVNAAPRVISEGNIIISSQSNLDDAETGVGFQWRRIDWTDDFISKEATAYLYDGIIEGYIRSVNSNYLWKFRPYYKSADGTYYYGSWTGMDPSDYSYFEPTVHTYDKPMVEGNTAEVRGYVQRGTDNIAQQGIIYWRASNQPSNVGALHVLSIPSTATTVIATGTVMEVELTDLAYNADYNYVAFVTTSENETFYGETKTFRTGLELGDVNGDGNISIADVTYLVNLIRNGAKPGGSYDINGDKSVNLDDVSALVELILGR